MFAKIPDRLIPVNSYLPKCNNKYQDPDNKPYRRLSKENFITSHDKKREWIKETKLRLALDNNELSVLNALAFQTDPITGVGRPTILTLLKDIHVSTLSYRTVIRVLDRLAIKGAITKERGPRILKDCVWTSRNHYSLIGYEFKLPFKSDNVSCSLNSPLTKVNKDHNHIRERDDNDLSASPQGGTEGEKEADKVITSSANKELIAKLEKLRTHTALAERHIRMYGEAIVEKAYKMSDAPGIKNRGGYITKILPTITEDDMDNSKQTANAYSRACTISDKAVALAQATKILASKGIEDPIFDHSLTPKERYVKTNEYNSQRSSLAMQLENGS